MMFKCEKYAKTLKNKNQEGADTFSQHCSASVSVIQSWSSKSYGSCHI